MNSPKKWFTIVNPEAGSGNGQVHWPKIKHALNQAQIDFEFCFTEHKYHAVELTVSAVNQGYKKIIVVGGDGTLNEIVNGLFIQKKLPTNDVTIGFIGVGTGNDWQRMYSIPTNYYDKALSIKNQKTFLQDVGKVDFFESRIKQTRFFANVAGLGFDASVAKATNRLKESGHKGKFLYRFSLLKTLFSHRHSMVKATIDDKEFGGKLFSMSLGIGRYNGGGMMQLPNAIPDDGLFDVTIIAKIRPISVLRNIYRLYNGTILNHPKIFGYQGSTVTVTSKPPLYLEVDGESLGSSPFSFSIIPKGIRVVVGADFTSLTNPVTAVCS